MSTTWIMWIGLLLIVTKVPINSNMTRIAPVVETQTLIGSTQSPIAFTKGQTMDLHLTKGEKIPFNKRITEIGASFDSEGSFVCQTPGLYVFTYYGLTANNSRLWLEMMKNDQLIATIFGYTTNDFADAGNAAVVHLNAGDKVYVKAHDHYNINHALFGRRNQIYTTFTGELLFADNFELDVENFYGPVGFSAVLTKHSTIVDGSALVFDKVITNIGSGCDQNTGIFTAPSEGTFFFHFHALVHFSSKFWIELFHNDQQVMSSYGYTNGSYADAGNTAVFHLRKGDLVKIRSRPGTNTTLFGTSDQYYTTFCEALLSPTVHEGFNFLFKMCEQKALRLGTSTSC